MVKQNLNLEFRNGFVYFENLRSIIFPINAYLLIIHELSSILSKKILENKLTTWSKIDSLNFFKKLPKKISKLEKIKLSLILLNKIGLGELNLKKISNNKIKINFNNHLSIYYNKLFSEKAKVLPEILLIIFFKNILELIYSKKVNFKIDLKTSEVEYTLLENLKINTQINTFLETKTFSFSINSLIKKILISKHLKLDFGKLRIWNIRIMSIPIITILSIFNFINKNNKSFLPNFAISQGIIAAKTQKIQFGISNNKVLLEKVLLQSELLGIGKLNYNIEDSENFNFSFNLGLIEYEKLFSKKELQSFKIYSCNLVKGIFNLIYNKNTNLIFGELNYLKNTKIKKDNNSFFISKLDSKLMYK